MSESSAPGGEGSITEFALAANKLKSTPRRGWASAGVPRAETVADHSWATAMLAIVAAREAGLDAGRAAELAIVHDLAEATTGDFLPGEVPPEEKRAGEDRAMREFAARLPAASGKHLAQLWTEYSSSASPEARLVHDLDKFEMAVQAHAYGLAGVGQDGLAKFRESASRQVSDPTIRAWLKPFL